MQRILVKKCLPFTVRSVCRVKRFTTGSKTWRTFHWWRTGWNGDTEVAKTTIKKTSMLRVTTHWQSDGTSVSTLVEDMSRIKCLSQVRVSHVLPVYPSVTCTYQTDLHHVIAHATMIRTTRLLLRLRIIIIIRNKWHWKVCFSFRNWIKFSVLVGYKICICGIKADYKLPN
jgi:hypothetical protein